MGMLRVLLVYGLPLSLSLVLLEVIHTSDRVMLGWLRGYAEAGNMQLLTTYHSRY